MGELIETIKLSLLAYGDGIPDNFKNNSLFFYEKYQKSGQDVLSINIGEINPGGFYFFTYLDDSNWMKFSPVFVADYKKLNNQIVVYAVNFNFVPIEIRTMIFDKYITEKDFELNSYLKTDFQGMYAEIRKLGFEYALMEFNAVQLVRVHRIHLELLPRFLYSQHPINIYDPKKLYSIWSAKIANRDQRHKELASSLLSDFYDINNEISEKYDVLNGHIKRMQTSMTKYGKG